MTYDKFLTALVVILILAAAYNTLMTAWKNHREMKLQRESPVNQLKERVDRHDELLAKDKDRIDRLEIDVGDLRKATRILLRQGMAINAHMISGNDISKLKESTSEIEKYLLDRE